MMEGKEVKKAIDNQAEQLLEYFKEFDLTDLLGFGLVLGVQEEENFTEYCTKILIAFYQENRLKRKQLLKLAKDIAVNNRFSVPASKEIEDPGDTQGE